MRVYIRGRVDANMAATKAAAAAAAPPLGAAKAGRRWPVAGRGSLDTALTALEGFDTRHCPRVLAS